MKIKRLILIFIFTLFIFSGLFAQEGLIESLRFKDADIRMVLEAISQKAYSQGKKINIVVTPEVQGTISLDLEKVDWQTALSAVLSTTGYGRTRHKDVIIVAPMEKIKEVEKSEKHDHIPRTERKIPEDPQIDNGDFGKELRKDKHSQGRYGDIAHPDDPLGRKPVFPLPFVQDNLKASKTNRQKQKAQVVNLHPGALHVGRVDDE